MQLALIIIGAAMTVTPAIYVIAVHGAALRDRLRMRKLRKARGTVNQLHLMESAQLDRLRNGQTPRETYSCPFPRGRNFVEA